MWNKKGVSAIVATVLIVLITIAAASLIFSTVVPFVKNSLSASTECIPYQGYLEIEEELGYTCYDAKNLTGFSVRVVAPSTEVETLERFDAVFSNSDSLRKASVINGSAINNGVEGIRMLDKSITRIAIPSIGEVQTYVYNAGSIRPEKIELYPVLKSGKICDKSVEIKLVSCKGVAL